MRPRRKFALPPWTTSNRIHTLCRRQTNLLEIIAWHQARMQVIAFHLGAQPNGEEIIMSPLDGISEAIRLTYPDAQTLAMARLFVDGNLYNGSGHRLRDGLTKDKAGAILLLACSFAKASGYPLVLSADEKKLMAGKFEV